MGVPRADLTSGAFFRAIAEYCRTTAAQAEQRSLSPAWPSLRNRLYWCRPAMYAGSSFPLLCRFSTIFPFCKNRHHLQKLCEKMSLIFLYFKNKAWYILGRCTFSAGTYLFDSTESGQPVRFADCHQFFEKGNRHSRAICENHGESRQNNDRNRQGR